MQEPSMFLYESVVSTLAQECFLSDYYDHVMEITLSCISRELVARKSVSFLFVFSLENVAH